MKNSNIIRSPLFLVSQLVGIFVLLSVFILWPFAPYAKAVSEVDYPHTVFYDDMSSTPDNWLNQNGATHTFSNGFMHVADSDPTLSGRVRATLAGTQTHDWYVETTLNITSHDFNGSYFQGLWRGVDIDTLSWFFSIAFDLNYRLLAWDSNADAGGFIDKFIYTGYDVPLNTPFKIEVYGNMSYGTYTIEINDIVYGTYHSDQNISSLYRLILDGFTPQPETLWTIDVGPTIVKDKAAQPTLGEQAAGLTKQVINGPYLGDGNTWGGKGWDPNQATYVTPGEIFSGYHFWNNATSVRAIDFGAGLDCSGLTQWAFNRSFDPKKSLLKNVIRWDNADGQYLHNTIMTTEANLQPGDLLFLDKNGDGVKDHVGMYVGVDLSSNVVEAFSPALGIRPTSKDEFKMRPGFIASQSFRRVTLSPAIAGQIKAGSPVDLTVTDPEGFTITPQTGMQTDEEFLREIPGELYYTENVLGPDGRPEDIVYWPKQKTGDYIIKVSPEVGVSPTETYSVEFTVREQTTVLASDAPLSQIPSEGYGINLAESGAINTFVPVAIDIKPGGYQNSINLDSRGTVPVAIFGNNTFDVHQMNPESITLANAPIKLKNNGKLMIGYEDINGDGFTDLVTHTVTRALQLTSASTKAELNGLLIDGRKIKGSDSVKIVP